MQDQNTDSIYNDDRFEELGRIAPHSPETETALLGSIILDNDCMYEVSQKIRVEDFYMKRHQRIYEAIMELFNRDENVDYVTLDNILKSKHKNEEAYGGLDYLTELPSRISYVPSISSYIDILRKHSTRRSIIRMCRQYLEKSYDGTLDASKTLDDLIGDVEGLFQNSDSTIRDLNSIADEYVEAMKHTGNKVVNFGYSQLDYLTGGVEYGTMGVIASWSSVGKTTFCLNIAKKQALDFDIPVLFISMETKRDQLFKNLLACESNESIKKFRDMTFTDTELTKVDASVHRLRSAPFYIDDSTSLNIKQIREKIYKAVHDYDCRVVYIDYYQLISSESDKMLTREQRLSAISKELREIVNKHNIVLFLIAQLRDENYTKGSEPPKPSPHHLRESRAVYHDCDLCLTLSRESYFKDGGDNTVEVMIQKQRTGPRRVSAKLNYMPEKMLFEEPGKIINLKSKVPEGYEEVNENNIGDYYATFPFLAEDDDDE